MTREVQVLRVIDVLVAKKHDLPAVERGAYGRHQRRRERLAQIHAMYLRAGEDRKRPDVQKRGAHRCFLCATVVTAHAAPQW